MGMVVSMGDIVGDWDLDLFFGFGAGFSSWGILREGKAPACICGEGLVGI